MYNSDKYALIPTPRGTPYPERSRLLSFSFSYSVIMLEMNCFDLWVNKVLSRTLFSNLFLRNTFVKRFDISSNNYFGKTIRQQEFDLF